jgi:uncharacterized membrane protein YfcA
MYLTLSVAFGLLVGFALGLTGGGGSIFAVPLMVYGLGAAPREAVGVSLVAVGATALAGALAQLRAGEVEVGPGLLFSLGGVLGAPLGALAGARVPDGRLMLAFAALMLVTAGNMLLRPGARPDAPGRRHVCPREEAGRLFLTPRCVLLLAAVGLGTGVLAGLFGVGGGFVIVPALVFFAGMPIHRAVATSLLAISLISAAGVASHLAAGHPLPWGLAVPFVAGGVAGMAAGGALRGHLPARRLRQVFAGSIIGVAAFVVARAVL